MGIIPLKNLAFIRQIPGIGARLYEAFNSIQLGVTAMAVQGNYKRRPSDQFLAKWKQRRPWLGKITKILGYDAGEPHRVKDYGDTEFEFWSSGDGDGRNAFRLLSGPVSRCRVCALTATMRPPHDPDALPSRPQPVHPIR